MTNVCLISVCLITKILKITDTANKSSESERELDVILIKTDYGLIYSELRFISSLNSVLGT